MNGILKCRLCLNDSQLKLMNGEIKEIIRSLLSIRLCNNVALSQHICSLCYDKVLNFQKFKEKVVRVQKSLNAYAEDDKKQNAEHENVPAVKKPKKKTERVTKGYTNLISKVIRSLNKNNLERSSVPANNDTEATSIKVESRDESESELKNKKSVLTCFQCGAVFYFQEALDRHKKKRHPVFECDRCSFKSINRTTFAQHKRSHLNLTQQKICSLCFMICDNTKLLFRHREEQHSKAKRKYYMCSICNQKNFRSILLLKQHKRQVHSDGGAISKSSDSKTTESKDSFATQVIMNVHLKNCKIYKCKRCAKKLSSRQSLCRHEKWCLMKAGSMLTKSTEKVTSVNVEKGREKYGVSLKNCGEVIANQSPNVCSVSRCENVEREDGAHSHKILDHDKKHFNRNKNGTPCTAIEKLQMESTPPNTSVQRLAGMDEKRFNGDKNEKSSTATEKAQVKSRQPNTSIQCPTEIHACNKCGLVFYSIHFLTLHDKEQHGQNSNAATPVDEKKTPNDSVTQPDRSKSDPKKLPTDCYPNFKPALSSQAMSERNHKFKNTNKNFDRVPSETPHSVRRQNFGSSNFPRPRESKPYTHPNDLRGRYAFPQQHYNKFSKFKTRRIGGKWNNYEFNANPEDRGVNKTVRKEPGPVENKPSSSKTNYFVENEISMSIPKEDTFSSRSSTLEISIMPSSKNNKQPCTVCSKVDCCFSCNTCRSCFVTQNLYLKHVKNCG